MAEEETDVIISNLKHRDIVGAVQTSREGLGNAAFKPFSCMNRKERRKEIVLTAKNDEERKRHNQLVQCSQQGQCTAWEDEVIKREIKWSHLWKWPAHRYQFLIKSTFDMMPTPSNLFKWKIATNDKCTCGGKGTLFHILSNCPLGLTHRFTWRRNQVLKIMADAIKAKIVEINNGSKPKVKDLKQPVSFHKEGKPFKTTKERLIDDPDWRGHWSVVVDLANQHYELPIETTKRPDLAI